MLVTVAALVGIWLAREPLLWALAQMANVLGVALHRLVGLPFLDRFGGFAYMNAYWDNVSAYTGEHVQLTAATLLIGLAIALPVGVLLNRVRWLYVPVFGALDTVYTIPSIALFLVLLQVPGFGLSFNTALVVLVAYAQFILVRNVAAGMDGVPAEIKEAARGMGMNPVQVFFRVELPLALPVIAGGFRIAAVATIGIASVAAFIGIHDLGFLFYDAVYNFSINSQGEIEAGAIAVAALAVFVDVALRFLEGFIPANRVARAGKPSRLMMLAKPVFPSWGKHEDVPVLTEEP